MRQSNFALRLAPSLLEDARKLAQTEGRRAKSSHQRRGRRKLAALRTESYFGERARRASVPKALKIIKRAGAGNPPMKGDEIGDGGSGSRRRSRWRSRKTG
jgi:hypothetical protein